MIFVYQIIEISTFFWFNQATRFWYEFLTWYQFFLTEKNYGEARKYFIYTNEGSQCAAFLIEYHVVAGFPGEVDLFVTQAVLQ